MPFSHSSPLRSDLPDEATFTRSLRRGTLALAFVIGVPALTLLALVLYLLYLAASIERTDRVIAKGHSLQRLLVDMESGLRGYQATEDERFLQPFNDARPLLDPQLDALKASVLHDPNHTRLVSNLEAAIGSWRGFVAEALSEARRGPAGRETEFQLRGKAGMDRVRGSVSDLADAGVKLRAQQVGVRQLVRWAVIVGLVLLALIVAPVATIWVRRLLQKTTTHYHRGLALVEQRANELHVTLRSIGDAVVATNERGEVAFLNPVAERLMGWNSSEARGKPLAEVFQIFNEQTGLPAENPVARVLRERVVVGLANHTVLRSRHGRETPIEDSAAPILDDEGEIRGVILVFHDVGEKREVELRLQDAELRSRTALEIGDAGSWVWEVEPNLVTGDAMLARTFNVPLEACQRGEKVGTFLTALAPEDRPRVEQAIRAALESGGLYETEFRVRNADGKTRWVQARGRVEQAANGGPTRLLGFVIDTTTARVAEQTIRDSEHRFRFLNSVGEATRDLLNPREIMAVVARLLGEHLAVSRCAYAEVERDSERFRILDDYTHDCASTVGDYHLSLFGPRATAEMRSGGTLVVTDVDAELSGEVGAETFNAIGIKAIICCPLIRDGALSAMMAVHQTAPRLWTKAEIALVEEIAERSWSIIARARAEGELRDSSERFRLLAGVVSLQVWTAGPDGRLDYANQECADYFGSANLERDVLGHAWAQYVHPDDLPVAQQRWQVSLTTGQRYETEFRLRDQQGDHRWFLVRAEAMRNSAGEIEKWFGSNTDIHALKLAQAEAERASRTKDDFLAALSHELRTPLTPVLMTAAALREDETLPLEVREQLGMIERNIALEARLIDDLLDLTRIARGKLDVRRKSCDAHSLIGLAIEIVRDESLTKSISIERHFDAQNSGLFADPARFQQVIWNLLRNAVKFTPRGGVVSIRTRDEVGEHGARQLHIEIADTGIGISPAQLENIFLPFEQGGLTGDHRFGGVGLGLAIVRAIVDQHGGSIRAQSAGANRGATFIVEFPEASPPSVGVHELSEPSRRSSEPPAAAVAHAALALLLVEDHEPTLQVMTRLLTRAGHAVTAVGNMADALAAAAAKKFDLVISDLGLPDGTGTELMQQLRQEYGLSGIALSGYGMDEDLARSREAGFVTHLIKPVDFHQLERALREIASSPAR